MGEEINIEIDDKVADGIYSNFAVIAHSSSEFVLDFIRLMPGSEKGQVKCRVILAPEQAKRLLISLQENIKRYETTFGDIKIHTLPHEQDPINITPMGEA